MEVNKEELMEQENQEVVHEAEGEDKKAKKLFKKAKKPAENAEMEALKQELGELKDKYLRLFAEFDNYKKRTVREKLEIMRTAASDTLSSLLPVLDDFDRAKANAENPGSNEHFSEGMLMLYNKLYNTLGAQGLRPMQSTGEPFNPDEHEAITEIPAPTEELRGRVVDTIEKGYYLNDKIIRHAKVVVGK